MGCNEEVEEIIRTLPRQTELTYEEQWKQGMKYPSAGVCDLAHKPRRNSEGLRTLSRWLRRA